MCIVYLTRKQWTLAGRTTWWGRWYGGHSAGPSTSTATTGTDAVGSRWMMKTVVVVEMMTLDQCQCVGWSVQTGRVAGHFIGAWRQSGRLFTGNRLTSIRGSARCHVRWTDNDNLLLFINWLIIFVLLLLLLLCVRCLRWRRRQQRQRQVEWTICNYRWILLLL